jgi:hypothetical protein
MGAQSKKLAVLACGCVLDYFTKDSEYCLVITCIFIVLGFTTAETKDPVIRDLFNTCAFSEKCRSSILFTYIINSVQVTGNSNILICI